jgi:acyl-CoA hydrolase
MEARKISESQVVMTEMVLPTHTNALGSVFGGTVMSWIDIAAAICAQRHSRKTVVTAHIDDLQFVAPVYKGWVINLKASVNYVGTTSMEVGVRVDAENPMTGEKFHTASAYLTFVAVDAAGKPSAVPGLSIETADEKRRHKAALVRKDNRLRKRQTSLK